MKKLLPLFALPALFMACGDIFEADISRGKVSVIAPSDKAELPEGNVAFRWDVLDGAGRYRVTVVSPDFRNAETVLKDTVVYPDSLAAGAGLRLRLAEGEYQWSIQAFNEAYGSVRSVYDLKIVPETGDASEPEEEMR